MTNSTQLPCGAGDDGLEPGCRRELSGGNCSDGEAKYSACAARLDEFDTRTLVSESVTLYGSAPRAATFVKKMSDDLDACKQ